MPTPTNEPDAGQASAAAATGAERAARSLDPWAVAVDDATASMREWAGALKTSFATAVAGGYTAKSLTGDVAAMAARGARDWARLVINTAGIARAVATTPITPAAPTSARDHGGAGEPRRHPTHRRQPGPRREELPAVRGAGGHARHRT